VCGEKELIQTRKNQKKKEGKTEVAGATVKSIQQIKKCKQRKREGIALVTCSWHQIGSGLSVLPNALSLNCNG
jgi:peptide subunit release factor 1 (eRF1)